MNRQTDNYAWAICVKPLAKGHNWYILFSTLYVWIEMCLVWLPLPLLILFYWHSILLRSSCHQIARVSVSSSALPTECLRLTTIFDSFLLKILKKLLVHFWSHEETMNLMYDTIPHNFANHGIQAFFSLSRRKISAYWMKSNTF